MVVQVKNYNAVQQDRKIKYSIFLVNSEIEITPEVEQFELNFTLNDLSTGYIILNDLDNNVNLEYSLIGGELIKIIISHDVSDRRIVMKYYIINEIIIVEKSGNVGTSQNKYRLNLVSPPLYNNIQNKISKGYVGPKTPSEIVKDIIVSHIPTHKLVGYSITPSTNNLDNFIIPYEYPLEAIKDMKTIAEAKSSDSEVFIFYENIYVGMIFDTMNNIISIPPKYTLSKNMTTGFKETPLMKIYDDKFITGHNIMRTIKESGLATTYVYFDDNTKKYTEKTFKIDESFVNKIGTLGKQMFYNKAIIDACSKSQVKVFTPDPNLLQNFVYTDFRSKMFDMFKIKINLPGTFDLNVGDTVYYQKLKQGTEFDDLYTGTWLISELKLKISRFDEDNNNDCRYKNLKTDIVIVKDCYGNMNRKTKSTANLLESNQKINNIDSIIGKM